MEMAVDFRQGLPCQQAASELMLPGSFGADGQDLMGPFPPNGQPPIPYYPRPSLAAQHPANSLGVPSPQQHQHLPYSPQQPYYQPPWGHRSQQGFPQQGLPQQYGPAPGGNYPDQYWQGIPHPHLPSRTVHSQHSDRVSDLSSKATTDNQER